MMNIKKVVFFSMLICYVSCWSLNKNGDKTNLKNEKKPSHCSIIMLKDSTVFDIESDIVQQTTLLPHLMEQQSILQKYSLPSDTSLTPDGKYLLGRFDCGILELTTTKVDGEPPYIYGQTNNSDTELEFLIYSLSIDQVDALVIGNSYKIYWMETIALMEPYDHGYQRCYIAYKIDF